MIEHRQTLPLPHDPKLPPDLSYSLNPVKEIADTMKLVVLRRQAEGDFASPWASCYS